MRTIRNAVMLAVLGLLASGGVGPLQLRAQGGGNPGCPTCGECTCCNCASCKKGLFGTCECQGCQVQQ